MEAVKEEEREKMEEEKKEGEEEGNEVRSDTLIPHLNFLPVLCTFIVTFH